MSISQREQIKAALDWILKLSITALSFLAYNTFMDVKNNIHEARTELNSVKEDVHSVRERLIRIETKMDIAK